MKNLVLLVSIALAPFAVADVRTYPETTCHSGAVLKGTKHGNCYNLEPGVRSAAGCSVGHNLRVYTYPNCDKSGFSNTVKPQKCVNMGGDDIRSIECLS
jgi:hypothetical protein